MNEHSVRFLALVLAAAAVAMSPGGAAARDAMLTFKVHVPESTPPDASVFITGNVEMLGPWDPGKIELGRIGEHLYAITLVLPVDTQLRYKFTRGSWETVEKGPDFEEIPDREHIVVGDEDVGVWVDGWRDFAPRRDVHTVVGDLRVHFDFPATKLGNKRTILVLLPAGYDEEPERRYPVLYMQDGQNLFDAATAYIGVEWSVDETLTRMIASGDVEPLIVVGIANTPDRAFEYTPAADRAHGGGGASLYADFVINDLKPFIDQTYRTEPGREHTGVMGSSLGGLVSLFLAWEHPDVFSRVGAMSTPYGWADGQILSYIEGRPAPTGVRVWIDMGTAEDQTDRNGDGVPDVIEKHRAMRDILMEKGLSIPRTLRYVEDEGGVHNERAWAARFPRAVEFLFPAR
jgi:predicted alpha/beta superfamily hydrolase